MGRFDFNKVKVNLKLALNRMKIQKQKKMNEVKMARKNIAIMLRDGKEEVARVKVEAIIRDDMLLQAFEILDLFVELLLSRIELLKMQSGCPFDLKEAVCTIIYAAPRLSQKELTEVRHQFIEKYGKPFASEAMENRGNCVNAKLIHKLSIITPDNATVFEYLQGIATEYGIDWTSPLSAAPDEMSMFPTPPQMAAPMQPQPYSPPPPAYQPADSFASQFPAVPPPASSQPPPYGGGTTDIYGAYTHTNNNNNNNNNVNVYGAAAPPPAYSSSSSSLDQLPPPPYQQHAPPPAPLGGYSTPGNPNDDQGMDDLMARFNNLRK